MNVAEYVAREIFIFRTVILTNDPEFFNHAENVTCFLAFCQQLPYLWINEKQHSADLAKSLFNLPGKPLPN